MFSVIEKPYHCFILYKLYDSIISERDFLLITRFPLDNSMSYPNLYIYELLNVLTWKSQSTYNYTKEINQVLLSTVFTIYFSYPRTSAYFSCQRSFIFCHRELIASLREIVQSSSSFDKYFFWFNHIQFISGFLNTYKILVSIS